MKLIRLIAIIMIVSACGQNQTATKTEIDEFDFLNQILRDTSIVKRKLEEPFVVSDVANLPPPMREGREIDFVSQKLSEPDTIFLREQFRKTKNFTTDSLEAYGFTICKVSELRIRMNTDSLWNYIIDKYNGGYYSINRPIFNKAFNKAYINFGYKCGDYCGYSSSYIIKKENGKWVIEELLGFWES